MATALKLDGVWTLDRLNRWQSGTEKMAPESKMYIELHDATQPRLYQSRIDAAPGGDDGMGPLARASREAASSARTSLSPGGPW